MSPKKDTWSYSILGCDEAMDYFYEYTKMIRKALTQDESEKYPGGKIPYDFKKTLIERSYERLLNYAYKQKSRLAFIVLGENIMTYRAKMTEDLRNLILKYSDWKYEKDQLENEEDRLERKHFLDDFREKIKNYDGSKPVKIPLYTVTRVINERKEKGLDTKNIWRKNLDYSIKN
ncbi:MAG: hypothetical protein ACFE9S_09295 [Candidatus Hermodarchaeota archaeon]